MKVSFCMNQSALKKKNSSDEVEEDEAGRKTFMLKLES